MAEGSFRFDHVMLPVRDAAASGRFYADVLSMQIVEERQDADRHVLHVGYGARGSQPTVELIQDRRVPAIACGGGHICVNVPDLVSLDARLTRAGVTQARPAGWRDGRLIRIWICDPDGHVIEVSQAD